MTLPRLSATAAPTTDRLSRGAERLLHRLADARVGLLLILAVGLANLVAALAPGGAGLLDGWPYALLLGALALSGVAAVAVRAPATGREWRRPGPVRPGPDALSARIPAGRPAEEIASDLQRCGYRVRLERRRRRWAVHGVRRGWSRLAGHATHLAIVVIVLGAAIGAAYGSETVVSLHRGDQALLDTPRPGFTSAVRLEAFDAAFGPDGRPERLDTTVSFLREGEVVERRVLRVNQPGSFDGYLVHPWTYGPSARLRVTSLAGGPLADAPIPLAGTRDGVPVGSLELPTVGLSLGLALADATNNELGVSAVGPSGLVESVRLRPGEDRRLGPVVVELMGFDAWVTLASRRDPGLAVLFGGAALLSGSLAVAFWLPRRRVTVRPQRDELQVLLRGERFDRPADELDRMVRRLGRDR